MRSATPRGLRCSPVQRRSPPASGASAGSPSSLPTSTRHRPANGRTLPKPPGAADTMFDFSGRTILYTGAAGGVGPATPVLFLQAGARVVAVDNDPKKTAALTEAAAAHRDRLIMAPLDLSDATRLGEELGALSRQVGGFDVVINNAAIYPSKPFEDFSIEEHQAVQRVNVDAAIVAVKVALPHMRERAWGRILNISSITF